MDTIHWGDRDPGSVYNGIPYNYAGVLGSRCVIGLKKGDEHWVVRSGKGPSHFDPVGPFPTKEAAAAALVVMHAAGLCGE